MGDKTGISWTNATWNFIRGCSLVSEECVNCYAMIQSARFCKEGEPYYQITTRNKGGKPMWTGKIGFYEHMLNKPLSWQRPRLIFVNSMSDLFHEDLSVDHIRRGFDVMEQAYWHHYQILTKRAERMAEVMSSLVLSSGRHLGKDPLPNVWFGTSVGLEKTAIRIAWLCRTPAKIRFVSAEPLIGNIDWYRHLVFDSEITPNWVIFGGESQTNCRPLELDWIREGIKACRKLGIAPYVKQLGTIWAKSVGSKDSHGGIMEEWPEDLRVQEYPIDITAALAWDGTKHKKTSV